MICFTIPYPPTKDGKSTFCRRFGLNAYYSGKDYHARKRDADELHLLAWAAMKKAKIRKQPFTVPVEVRFYWNDGLDVDNHAVMGKAFLDAMKGYIVQNDNRKWVRKVSHEFWDGNEILTEVWPYEGNGKERGTG